jgi:hypothetical protein
MDSGEQPNRQGLIAKRFGQYSTAKKVKVTSLAKVVAGLRESQLVF